MSFWSGRKQEELAEDPTNPAAARQAPSATRQPAGFESILGANATLRGDLKSLGNVRLDGTFEGTLEIDGNVLVGETGKITADINAKNVSIAGAVRGNVSGKKVQILRTGRVWGDITASAISTEEGCFIEGKITMVTHAAAQTFDQTHFAPPVTPEPDSDSSDEPEAAVEIDTNDQQDEDEQKSEQGSDR